MSKSVCTYTNSARPPIEALQIEQQTWDDGTDKGRKVVPDAVEALQEASV